MAKALGYRFKDPRVHGLPKATGTYGQPEGRRFTGFQPANVRLLPLTIPLLAVVLAIGFDGCGTLNLIGHARIRNDAVMSFGPDAQSAVVVEVDGQPVKSGPLPALEDTGAHLAAWVSAGKHLFKVGITSVVRRPGTTSPTKYVRFSATVHSGTTYLLFAVDGRPILFEQKSGPGANSVPPLNEPILLMFDIPSSTTGSPL
jgi:hypothetical protein